MVAAAHRMVGRRDLLDRPQLAPGDRPVGLYGK
jgi:hypothetical protein